MRFEEGEQKKKEEFIVQNKVFECKTYQFCHKSRHRHRPSSQLSAPLSRILSTVEEI